MTTWTLLMEGDIAKLNVALGLIGLILPACTILTAHMPMWRREWDFGRAPH